MQAFLSNKYVIRRKQKGGTVLYLHKVRVYTYEGYIQQSTVFVQNCMYIYVGTLCTQKHACAQIIFEFESCLLFAFIFHVMSQQKE